MMFSTCTYKITHIYNHEKEKSYNNIKLKYYKKYTNDVHLIYIIASYMYTLYHCHYYHYKALHKL